jgi:tetratricopeptide (TPR) repeat protein
MRITYFLFFLFITQIGFSQEVEIKREAHQLIENRAYYLNGGLNAAFGGNSRAFIKIDLPPNTVEWYYTFSTSQGKSGAKNLTLAIQLASMLTDPSGLSSKALSAFSVPQGEASADIYLLDSNNLKGFREKYDQNGGTFRFISEGTVQNVKQAVVRVDDVKRGTWYLGLRNPSTTTGLNINIEVVAITETEVLIAKSDKQQKAELYTNLGWAQFESGNYQKCIEYCDKANAESEIGIAYANKGLALLMLGKDSEAMDVYIKGITIIKKQQNSDYYIQGAIDDLDKVLNSNQYIVGAKEIKQVLLQSK